MCTVKAITVAGRLFQARMWREYAMAWDGRPTSTTGVGREWVAGILRVSRSECLRRARVNVLLARRTRERMLNMDVKATGAPPTDASKGNEA